jgi:RND family efflux transporter MFP subunit
MKHRYPSIALAALLVVSIAACEDTPATDAAQDAVRAVRVSEVQTQRQIREVRFSGVTRAAQRATLAFLISGTLTQRPVELGEGVVVGQTIAWLYNPTLEPAVAASAARLRELEVRVEQLQRDVKRAADLRERGLISQDDLEQVRTELDATRASRDLAAANLAEARNQLAEAGLVAPFDASVDATFFEPGEFVAAGQPVVQLSNTNRLEVEFEIPETLISQFAAGDAVTLSLPFLDQRRVAGRVVHVGDAGGPSGGLFPVEIELDRDSFLRPGLTAELLLELPSTPRLIVPLAAVLDPGTGRPRVYRVVDGRIDPVPVQIGQLYNDRVEVSGPLDEGDRVVVTGLSSLTPGQRVQVLQ